MLKQFMSIVLSIGVGSSIFAAGSSNRPEEIISPIEKVFIPKGFDNNDSVQLILQGTYTNTCYKSGRTGYEIDKENKLIKVWASSYRYPNGGSFCAQALIPFMQTIQIGMLDSGDYDVVFHGTSQNIVTQFKVYHTESKTPDEYLYAPVDNVNIKPRNLSPTVANTIQVKGSFPRLFVGCMKLVELKVVPSNDNIIVVLPIADIFYGDDCIDAKYEFEAEKILDNNSSQGINLIHTRVTNGNAINVLWDSSLSVSSYK